MRDRRAGIGIWWLLAAFAPAGLNIAGLNIAGLNIAGPAQAEEAAASPARGATVGVRAGSHPGYGRLVVDVAAGTQYSLSRDGDRVRLHFSNNPFIGTPAAPPRNVLSVSGGDGEAELVVAAGTRVRPSRIGARVVVDVLDPSTPVEPRPARVLALALPVPPIPPEAPPPLAASAEPAASTMPASSTPIEPAAARPIVPAQNAEAGPEQGAPPRAPPSVTAMPALLNPKGSGPVALLAARMAPAVAGPGVAFSVPFGAEVGAAALRLGALALVVFDQKRPIDLAALRADPVLAGASVQLLPAATVIRLRLPAGMEVALLRPSPNAWTVAVLPNPAPIRPIRPILAAEEPSSSRRARVLLAGDAPGHVVSLADPDTGATLLVGTQIRPGQGVAAFRRTPHYVLLPTWQGVAVQPLADSLSLRAVKDGFVLAGADLPMVQAAAAVDAESLAYAGGLTRRFDLPALPPEDLQRRMQLQVSEAAIAPPRARGRKRLAAAKTMIALGLGVEAQAMLQIATEDDPVLAASVDVAGLSAIAALLAGRIEDSRAIDDPRLSGTDEVAFWRAIRAARQQVGSPQAAAVFATTLPLALTYPPGLRDRLLPVAIETMIGGGEAAAAEPALARAKDDPRLALARAMLLQAEGNTDGALAAYDAVVHGPDRRQRALAASHAVELSLAAHRIDAPRAADALDRQLYSWRGDRQEFELRKRVATLRAESGAWRPALALLRDTLSVFPDQKAEIQSAMQTHFAGLLRDKAADAISPLDLIALLDENADLLAEAEHPVPQEAGMKEGGVPGSGVQALLAEKLLALDLPRRAGPLLERLMQPLPSGAAKAGFGASLAALRLREGDYQGVLKALSASDSAAAASDLPAALAEQRALLFATASARTGGQASAMAALAPLTGTAASELRVTILEQAGDWPAAAQALADQAARLVPAEGLLNDSQRRLLVRLASAASQSGDEALLERLRTREAPRMAKGPLADMFALLTAGRVQSTADLKRSAREMALARTLPAGFKALEEPLAAPAQLAGSLPAPAR